MSEKTNNEAIQLEKRIKELEEILEGYKREYVCKDELGTIYRKINSMKILAQEMYTGYFKRYKPLRTEHEALKVASLFDLNRAKMDLVTDCLQSVCDDLDEFDLDENEV